MSSQTNLAAPLLGAEAGVGWTRTKKHEATIKPNTELTPKAEKHLEMALTSAPQPQNP